MGYPLVAVIAVLAALLVGFAAGFVVFKRSQRWCLGCGSLITRAHCPHQHTTTAAPTREGVRQS